MKTPIILAVVLAAGAQAREPENLAALVDEMAVLERVLGAALQSQISGLMESRYDLQTFQRRTGMELERWLQERVRTIEAEYLVRQGILISLQFSSRRMAHDPPDSLFMTLARTANPKTGWSGLSWLEPDDFTALKRLVDQQDQTREKYEELVQEWDLERQRAQARGEIRHPVEDPGIHEMGAAMARVREQQTAIDAEIQRLRGRAETTPEVSTDDIHGALIQVVCDYAMLKSLPDDEYLTLKLSRLTSPREESRTGTRWTYYVLAKQDVVECRRGAIDAAELRQRADVYSLPHD